MARYSGGGSGPHGVTHVTGGTDETPSVQFTPQMLNSIIGWSCDTGLASGTGQVSAGVIYCVKIPFVQTANINRLWVNMTVAGGTLTAAQNFVGIYQSDGTKLGTSADLSGAGGGAFGGSAGWVGGTLTPAGAGYLTGDLGGVGKYMWGAILFNGTTSPTFAKMPAANANLINPNGADGSTVGGTAVRCGTVLTGQTSLPASINPNNLTAATHVFSMILS